LLQLALLNNFHEQVSAGDQNCTDAAQGAGGRSAWRHSWYDDIIRDERRFDARRNCYRFGLWCESILGGHRSIGPRSVVRCERFKKCRQKISETDADAEAFRSCNARHLLSSHVSQFSHVAFCSRTSFHQARRCFFSSDFFCRRNSPASLCELSCCNRACGFFSSRRSCAGAVSARGFSAPLFFRAAFDFSTQQCFHCLRLLSESGEAAGWN